jgi:hypothetical protein
MKTTVSHPRTTAHSSERVAAPPGSRQREAVNASEVRQDVDAELDRSARFGHRLDALEPEASLPRRLPIGRADDSREHQADRFADRILARMQGTAPTNDATAEPLRSNGGESASVQREAIGRESAGRASPAVTAEIGRATGGGRPLPAEIRRPAESVLRTDLRRVRVHDDARADALTRGLDSKAFAVRNDVFLRSGGCAPTSLEGERTILHELVHTAQQTMSPGGLETPVIQKFKLSKQEEWGTIKKYSDMPGLKYSRLAKAFKEKDRKAYDDWKKKKYEEASALAKKKGGASQYDWDKFNTDMNSELANRFESQEDDTQAATFKTNIPEKHAKAISKMAELREEAVTIRDPGEFTGELLTKGHPAKPLPIKAKTADPSKTEKKYSEFYPGENFNVEPGLIPVDQAKSKALLALKGKQEKEGFEKTEREKISKLIETKVAESRKKEGESYLAPPGGKLPYTGDYDVQHIAHKGEGTLRAVRALKPNTQKSLDTYKQDAFENIIESELSGRTTRHMLGAKLDYNAAVAKEGGYTGGQVIKHSSESLNPKPNPIEQLITIWPDNAVSLLASGGSGVGQETEKQEGVNYKELYKELIERQKGNKYEVHLNPAWGFTST